ncbi:hypothetical protein BLS_000489 [Venturia inaequalis]|uniref:Uncharacterized protein n=1 Tax=Venturia inaequalis TaxID=5025 RepID=A0A8H3UXU8_VENIN|nr:hypothetical protein BLS_000489 [Venturia inaequalis]
MHFPTALLLSAAVSGVLYKRQSPLENIAEPLGISSKPAKREKIAAVIRKDAVREKVWFGPYTLPPLNGTKTGPKLPMQMDPNSIQLNKRMTGFCLNCTVLSGKASLMYEDGTPAGVTSGVYIHHIVMVDMAKASMPFYLCEGQKGFLGKFPAAGFIVAGNDEADNYFTTPDGKFDSGYFISDKAQVAMQAELVNYKNVEQKIYITAEYEYLEGIKAETMDASVSLFSVTGCAFPDYHVSRDKPQYNLTSAIVPIPMDGTIINAKGHLHDGGDEVILTLNGETVCNSQAKYGLDPKATTSLAPNGKAWQVITEMTQCIEPVPVKKGDKLQMVSIYDNELHPPRMSADGHHGDSDEMVHQVQREQLDQLEGLEWLAWLEWPEQLEHQEYQEQQEQLEQLEHQEYQEQQEQQEQLEQLEQLEQQVHQEQQEQQEDLEWLEWLACLCKCNMTQ